MEYTIHNSFLTVTINTAGAQVQSIRNASGEEMCWCADPKIWNRHAPILFPYVGWLRKGTYQLDGKTYEGKSHGFARDSQFTVQDVQDTSITFRLMYNEDTLKLLPRKFCLDITYSLDGAALRQTTTVKNLDDRELRFGLGYHPGYTLPFDDKHKTSDYELRFDTPQTPEVVVFDDALMTHESHTYMENSAAIPLDDRMFDNDSIFLRGLHAKTVSIVEKDTGRAITMDLEGFPYFVFWSAMHQEHLHFLCLEPWHSHPDFVDADGDWNHKPCAAQLAPGENFTSHLNVTFRR